MEFNYLDTQQQRKFLKFNQTDIKQNDKLFSNKSQLVSQKLPPIDSTTIHYQPFQPSTNRPSFNTNERQESFLTPINSNQKNNKLGSRIPKITHNFYNLPEYSETIQSPELISASNNHFRNKSINSRLSSNQLSLNSPQLNTSRTHKFEHDLVQNLERPLFEKKTTIKTPLNNQLDRRQTNQNLKLFRQQYNQHKPSNISTDNQNYSYQKLKGFISPPSKKTYLASDILDQMFTFKMPDLMPSRHSNKQNGLVKAFAANTHQGLVRNYNEDRVSIILNMLKPLSQQLSPGQVWPSCSFFGIYDGHGGNKCAEFLKENLHQYIIQDHEFPSNPKQAITNACKLAENAFINKASNQSDPDRSGSCATFILIVEDICYSGNVGDSRIIASVEGNQCEQVTIDHKPNFESEKKRIINAGGHIYQTQAPKIAGVSLNGGSVLGPHRVFPGRLSVSRSFGDMEAKLSKYAGMEGVVVADPEITSFPITNSLDFLVLGCDGIFDKLTNQQVFDSVWKETVNEQKYSDVHSFSGMATINIMKNSLKQKSLDNVTVVMICFKNLKKQLKEILKSKNNNNENMHSNNIYKKIAQISGKIKQNKSRINDDQN